MYSISKHKLRREALLPPRNSKRVSLLRLDYAVGGLPFCVRHGKSLSIAGQEFVGLACVTPQAVKDCSDRILRPHANYAEIVYAPMHQGNYVDSSIDIDSQDPNVDLPMHADLTYFNMEQGDVQTIVRMFANELIKQVRFIEET